MNKKSKPKMIDSKRVSDDVINMFYNEFVEFRDNNREDTKELVNTLKEQNEVLQAHSEALLKITHTLNGNGCKGALDRITELEEATEEHGKALDCIATKEKIKVAAIGAVCAVFSSLGGIIAYVLSVWTNLKTHI